MNALADKFQEVFKKLRGYGKLTEDNVADAVREVRRALLSADVNYQVARDFCDKVKAKALGEEVSRSVRPGDLFVKIVHDELVAFFGRPERSLEPRRPLTVALCGLNGAGKTTSCAKLALWLREQGEEPVMIASDLSRPAAIDQLQTLGKQLDLKVLCPQEGDSLSDHLNRVSEAEDYQSSSVRLFDLAGRTELNRELMAELQAALKIIAPDETLLVADAALGQAAVEVAQQFSDNAELTGIILSKFDGDARGGAALSIQSVADCPVKFLGTGEKPEQFEAFEPERLVKRLLGMGDLMGIVEQVQGNVDMEDAARLQERMMSSAFNLQDFLDQMRQVKKLGPLQNLLGMMPGASNIPRSNLDDKSLMRMEAILSSMTRQERTAPGIINARRRQRIASGSGTSVREVNELLKRFREMKKMMGKLMKGGNTEAKLARMMSGKMNF
jgi:signal recognition particle subunit SRP54